MCHLQILKPQQAVSDLKKVISLEPKNTEVKRQLESTQKMVRKIEFEKVSSLVSNFVVGVGPHGTICVAPTFDQCALCATKLTQIVGN